MLVPFLGTTLGAACVFLLRRPLARGVERALSGFAAGVMVYVVVEELVPEMSEGEHSNIGAVLFAAGFTIMMALDVALG